VFRIDRLTPSVATASAVRNRVALLVNARSRRAATNPTGLRIIEGALALAIGVIVARIFWIGLGPLPTPPQVAAPKPPPAASAPTSANPFRGPAPAAAPPEEVVAAASLAETTLNLVLHGTWVDDKGGSAIIKTPDEKQARFKVGDTIWEGVTLERVYRDQVVINRAGVREALRIANRTVVATVDFGQQDIGAGTATPAAVAGFAQIGDLVSLAPEPDAVGGIRLILYPAGDEQAFLALGLRPGDILRGVDGQQIDADVGRALTLVQSLEGRDRVTIEVEREGVVTPLDIPLSEGSGEGPNTE
jgi:general secretion pathway protein C